MSRGFQSKQANKAKGLRQAGKGKKHRSPVEYPTDILVTSLYAGELIRGLAIGVHCAGGSQVMKVGETEDYCKAGRK